MSLSLRQLSPEQSLRCPRSEERKRSRPVRTTKPLRHLTTLALIFGMAASSYAGDQTKFTRFSDGPDANSGGLQVAKAVYRSKDSEVKVILYGVVHIADKSYFAKVNRDLQSYDAVLFEGVKPSKTMKPDASMKSIGEMQKLMCKMLGLTFQKDGIDYKGAKNFVHADMSYDEMKAAAGGDMSKVLPGAGLFNGKNMKAMAPLLKFGAKLAEAFMRAQPQLRNKLKLQFGRQLAGQVGGGGNPLMKGDSARVIIVERNKVAFKILEEQLAKRRSGTIAIFYGAAHMPDFHARLAKRGFTQSKKKWLTAWTIGRFKGGSVRELSPAPSPSPRTSPRRRRKRWL